MEDNAAPASSRMDSLKANLNEKTKKMIDKLPPKFKNPDTYKPDMENPDVRHIVIASVILYIVWIALIAGDNFSFGGLMIGLIVAPLVAWLSGSHLSFVDDIKFSPQMPIHMLRYLGAFFVALMRSNVDMAKRVLSPQLPINPAVVVINTQLESRLGKLLLANSITLTPGTLTVDVLEHGLQIHWVDSTKGTDLESATQAISASFEQHLREFIK